MLGTAEPTYIGKTPRNELFRKRHELFTSPGIGTRVDIPR